MQNLKWRSLKQNRKIKIKNPQQKWISFNIKKEKKMSIWWVLRENITTIRSIDAWEIPKKKKKRSNNNKICMWIEKKKCISYGKNVRHGVQKLFYRLLWPISFYEDVGMPTLTTDINTLKLCDKMICLFYGLFPHSSNSTVDFIQLSLFKKYCVNMVKSHN